MENETECGASSCPNHSWSCDELAISMADNRKPLFVVLALLGCVSFVALLCNLLFCKILLSCISFEHSIRLSLFSYVLAQVLDNAQSLGTFLLYLLTLSTGTFYIDTALRCFIFHLARTTS